MNLRPFRRSWRTWPRSGGAVLAGLALLLGPAAGLASASPLLESVKENPAVAQQLCDQFRAYNAQGTSATSPEVVSAVARSRDLNAVDAEVLITYVIGLHCPKVF
jgi:hypothetical protein